MQRALAVGLLALATAVLFACTNSTEGADQTPGVIIAPTEVPEGAPEATPAVEGVAVGALYNLAPGDCFNEYENYPNDFGDTVDITTQVACSEAHDAEVYAELTHPAAAGITYPGTIELSRWGIAECYARFEEFVGIEYELSELEIDVIVPEEPNWIAGPYRTAECYLWSRSGRLRGSMQGFSQ